MRALLVLMAAIIALTLALVFSPSLRAKAEAILFGQESAAPAPAPKSAESVPLAETAEKAGEAVKKAWDTAARKVAEAGGQKEAEAPVRAPAEATEPAVTGYYPMAGAGRGRSGHTALRHASCSEPGQLRNVIEPGSRCLRPEVATPTERGTDACLLPAAR